MSASSYRRRPSRTWMALGIAGLSIIVIGVSIIAGAALRLEAEKFSGRAVESMAEVVHIRVDSSNRRLTADRLYYTPTVVFVHNNLPADAHLPTVDDESIYHEGDTVRIRFDANDPSNAIDADRTGERSPNSKIGVGVIAVGVAAFGGAIFLRVRSKKQVSRRRKRSKSRRVSPDLG